MGRIPVPHALPTAGDWWPVGAGEGFPHGFFMPFRLAGLIVEKQRAHVVVGVRGTAAGWWAAAGKRPARARARQRLLHTATPHRISPAFFRGARQLVANMFLRGCENDRPKSAVSQKVRQAVPSFVWPVVWSIDDIGSYRAARVGCAAHLTRKRRNVAAHRRLTKPAIARYKIGAHNRVMEMRPAWLGTSGPANALGPRQRDRTTRLGRPQGGVCRHRGRVTALRYAWTPAIPRCLTEGPFLHRPAIPTAPPLPLCAATKAVAPNG